MAQAALRSKKSTSSKILTLQDVENYLGTRYSEAEVPGYLHLLERVIRVEDAIKTQNEKFELLIHQIDKRFDAVQIQIDKRFDAMQIQIDKRFDQADKRIATLTWVFSTWLTLITLLISAGFFLNLK